MADVLAILAIIVLTSLAVTSMIRHRAGAATEKEAADIRSHTGDAQHERSRSRRQAERSVPEQTGSTVD